MGQLSAARFESPLAYPAFDRGALRVEELVQIAQGDVVLGGEHLGRER